MRAVAVRSYGVPPAISDLPVPPADDAVLVRVTYTGLNPVDFQLADQLTPDSSFPFVLGVDVAGVVEKVPAQRSGLSVGDRVFGMARTHGSYAEYTAVPVGSATEPLARIPDGIPDEQAAVLPVAGIAALGSLDLLGLSPGERVMAKHRKRSDLAPTRCTRVRARATPTSSARTRTGSMPCSTSPAARRRFSDRPRYSNPAAGWSPPSLLPMSTGSLNER